jgi:CYTH domain-containing protein
MAELHAEDKFKKVASSIGTYLFGRGTVRYSAVNREREVRMDLKSLPEEISSTVKPLDIEQGYLVESDDGGTMVRIRKSQGTDGVYHYTMTAKNYPSYAEAETDIDSTIYDGLSDLMSKIERKKRYQWNGWDIDVISEGNRAGRIVAEYELPDGQIRVAMPEILNSVADLGDQGSR